MNGIVFPPKHTFVLNKLSLEFVEARRHELNDYWQKVRENVLIYLRCYQKVRVCSRNGGVRLALLSVRSCR